MNDEDRVRELLREQARQFVPRREPPKKMIRRAKLGMAASATAWLLVITVASVGAFVGIRTLRNEPSRQAMQPMVPATTPLPQSVSLVHVYHLKPEIMTAAGRFFGIDVTAHSTASIMRIDPDGTITRRRLTDPLATYFSCSTSQAQALFIGTSVIQRFSSASDELVRLDASTLTVTARMSLPGAVVALASDPANVWVALADRILRLDPVSLAVHASSVFPSGAISSLGSFDISSLAMGSGDLWATVGDAEHTTLYRLDPISLAVRSHTEVPGSGQGIRVVAGPESVWVTGENFIRSVDSSGHLSEAVPAPGLQVAASQGLGLVALFSSGNVPENLVQISSQAAPQARSEVGDAGAQLVVDDRDVWLLQGLSLAHWVLDNPAP